MAVIHHGDMLAVLPTLAEGSIDAVVTDPPYHLTSGNAVYDLNLTSAGNQRVRRQSRGGGFMGKQWDGGDVAFRPETWAEVFRVLKPGAHLVAFGGTRTYHRMACAIEDAGFEIRDTLAWMYGSGFPKSHDVSKGIDKAAGAEREVVGVRNRQTQGWEPKGPCRSAQVNNGVPFGGHDGAGGIFSQITAPATDAARQWAGWGTALKPAFEPIILARKPLSEPTVAANVLRWGTGALNIDGCRVETGDALTGSGTPPLRYGGTNHRPFHDNAEPRGCSQHPAGRWPANVAHDGSDEVLQAFAAFGERPPSGNVKPHTRGVGFSGGAAGAEIADYHKDTGTAARFFYCAKADGDDRLGSKHPTVKPLALMRWLCRLITPPQGTILDPFAGSGTTLQAALIEGFRPLGIEREAEYVADARHRLGHMRGADTPLFAEAAA